MSCRARWVPCIVAAVVAGWGPSNPASADTIYLVNGARIHTESITVERDRVVFAQLGGTVSIPLDQVARIVDDDETEARSAPAPDLGPVPATTSVPPAPPPGVEGARSGAPAAGADAWIDRINEVDARIDRVRRQLDRLPEYDAADRRLFRFSGQIRHFIAEREKWQRLLDGMQLRRRQLVLAARQAGVTPGELRRGIRR